MTTGMDIRSQELYGGTDPREHPRYSFRDASRATQIPVSTLRAWVLGQSYKTGARVGYFEPIISRPVEDDNCLSFTNLIEAHALRALRNVHGVSLQYIRQALDIAQQEFGIQRLLISPNLMAGAGQLFVETYANLMELSVTKQFAMRKILAQYLDRVEFDERSLPASFAPIARFPSNSARKIIVLSPFVSYGRAVIGRVGVTTQAIVQRLEAGESIDVVKEDYGLEESEIEEAILYEVAC